MKKLQFLLFGFLLLILTFLSSCASPQKYYFKCNEQTPEIVEKYIPQVFFEMGYVAHKNEIDNSKKNQPDLSYIARKKVFSTNKKKGTLTEYVQIQIDFKFDADSSVITTHYVSDFNEKLKIKTLSNEQMKKYENEFLTLKEKMYFYCDPRLKEREWPDKIIKWTN